MSETTKEQEPKQAKEEPKDKKKALDEKIEKLKEKTRQLQARRQLIDNRERAKANKIERAKDTRKKILLSSVILAREARGETTHPNTRELAKELTRDDDRALFDLPPITK